MISGERIEALIEKNLAIYLPTPDQARVSLTAFLSGLMASNDITDFSVLMVNATTIRTRFTMKDNAIFHKEFKYDYRTAGYLSKRITATPFDNAVDAYERAMQVI